ncbi:MAG: hypothetical protein FWF81_13545 [Defluviitaleaceae bacterium]|nr:hypothetical protein [Defluviitaleaceae bacterium]
MQRSANRLSSGFRINSAADDAAGLAISENMRAQIRGLDQASRNAQDGQAMILTTEGGLEEIGNIMQRVRELLVQASNDTNTQAQRNMIEQEIAQLGEEIHSMQSRVEFNTNRVLDIGVHGNIVANISQAQQTFASARIAVASASAVFASARGAAQASFAAAEASALEAFASAMVTINSTFNAAMASAETSYDRETALAIFEAARIDAEATRDLAIQSARSILNSAVGSALAVLQSARDQFAIDTHAFTSSLRNGFVTVSDDLNGVGMAWFQVGANGMQGIQFDFATVSQAVLVAGHLVNGIGDALVMSGSVRESGVGFGEDISPLIDAVNDGINSINSVRANLGAVQNRMDFTMRSLDISSENLQDSESRVRNADMAREMMRFTMSQVLSQAATAMLSQANQIPNNLLQVLR